MQGSIKAVGGPVYRPHRFLQHPAELLADRLALLAGEVLERAHRERHDRHGEDRLIPLGARKLEIGVLDEESSVEQPGVIVDLVVELELRERGLQLLVGPAPYRPEKDVGDRAGEDQTREAIRTHGLDRGVSHHPVDHTGADAGYDAALEPIEDERDQDRDEQQGPDDLDRLDPPDVHDAGRD